MRPAARWIGVAAAIMIAGLIGVFLFANPYTDQLPGKATFLIMGLLLALAAIGAWSAWNEKPFGLMLAFAGSFFPIGLYLLGLPTIFRWIGASDWLFILAAILIWIAHRQDRTRSRESTNG